MPKLFISHSNIDKALFVRPLCSALASKHIDVWLDEVEIRPGDDIIERIFDGIGSADAVAIVLSEASLQSRWVREELSVSVVRRITSSTRLIPILLGNVDVPVSLSHLKYIRATQHNVEEVAQEVSDVLLGIPTKQSVGPKSPIPEYTLKLFGLEKIDELLLRFISEELLAGTGHPYVGRGSLIAFADNNRISEKALEESLSALANKYYIEERHGISSRLPYAVKVTDFGFNEYLSNYYPNLQHATNDVVAAIINDGHFQDSQIAVAKRLPLALVDFILKQLESAGHVKLLNSLDGIYINAKPTLRRVLL